MNKMYLRKKIISIRQEINNKDELSKIITDKIINLDVFQNSSVIALYKSMCNEVDTSYLINYSLSNKKMVLLPKIVGNELDFIIVNRKTKYQQSKFNILEPIGEKYDGEIDLIIVPGISFDKENNRLGYGKGYYDRFLSKNKCYKIGVCFKNTLVNSLPIDDNDIKMDLVIHE